MARSSQKPDFSLETISGGLVAGIDEAGRGPLAGPVVAAAVILHPNALPPGLNDSKKLSATTRDRLYTELLNCADIGVGIADVEEVDRINILQATLRAMERAAAKLSQTPNHFLVDGNRLPQLSRPAQAIVKGDTRSLSIAAASIVAKVYRDRIMLQLHTEFPLYGWAENMGYGTPHHLKALRIQGPCRHHRLSFAPLRTEFSSYQR